MNGDSDKPTDQQLEPLPAEKLCNAWGDGNPILGNGPLCNEEARHIYYQGNDKKKLVITLQKMLKTLEYDLGESGPDNDGVDGKFGDKTEEAVRDFQEKNRDWEGEQLKVDGLVDPKTSDALNRAMVGNWYEHYQTPEELVNGKLYFTVTTKFLTEEGLLIEPNKAKESRVILVQSNAPDDKEPTYPLGRISVGINYPWRKYGWDFGCPPPGWNKSNWQNEVESDIINLKKLGISAIRWFILADGMLYGIDNDAPKFFNGRWHFDPPKISWPEEQSEPECINTSNYKYIFKDFEWVLKCLKKYNIKLIPSLIDYCWCFPGVDHIKDNIIPPRYIKGGRSDVIIDKGRRDAFFEYVLKPFLEISKEYKDIIFAWELINEPEWVTEGDPNGKEENKIVPVESMKAFIREGIGHINSEGFKSTVGFAKYETLERWGSSELGITLHQFHYYPKYKNPKKNCGIDPDGGKLHEHKFHPEYPCFIGEFAITTDETQCFLDWPDLKTDQSVYARLKWIEGKKYPCAFPWSMNANKDKNKKAIPWNPQFPPAKSTPQYDILRYTSGK